MIDIELPSGDLIQLDEPISGLDLAKKISPSLGRQAIAIKVDGEVKDLGTSLTSNAKVEVLTLYSEGPEVLDLIRHSCAHVMAEAITELFPGTQLAYGPPIKNGFFYDMKIPEVVSEKDFENIEKKMGEIIKADRPFLRSEYDPEEGMARVADDAYKLDNAKRAIEKGAQTLSFYKTGETKGSFEDLCSGPHIPSTGFLKAFKIMSVSGAYLRGDATSDALTRVYGTCFPDKKKLANHLNMLEIETFIRIPHEKQ